MKHPVEQIAETVGGKIEAVGRAPDGSGFATISYPLPKSHWLYTAGPNVPPMPFRMGIDDPRRQQFNEMVQSAARYAVRAATMNGADADYDPDAMVQNFVVGMLGYHSPDGLSADGWANPNPVPAAYPGKE